GRLGAGSPGGRGIRGSTFGQRGARFASAALELLTNRLSQPPVAPERTAWIDPETDTFVGACSPAPRRTAWIDPETDTFVGACSPRSVAIFTIWVAAWSRTCR